MGLTRHSLQPFEPSPAGVACLCAAQIKKKVLRLDFTITGEIKKLVIPDQTDQPIRKDELWQSTCFEFFFKIAGNKSYWEFNISPTGDWNLYRFSDYREGMKPELRVTAAKSERSQTENAFSLRCSFPVNGLISQDANIQLGLSCVVACKDGAKCYYALCHPGKQPDFHHQNSFLIIFPPCS